MYVNNITWSELTSFSSVVKINLIYNLEMGEGESLGKYIKAYHMDGIYIFSRKWKRMEETSSQSKCLGTTRSHIT